MTTAIAKNPALHFHSRQAIARRYRGYIDQMTAKLPALFGRLPKAKVEVLPVEEFREKSSSAAEYEDGTPDGSRPGHVKVNTGDFAKRTIAERRVDRVPRGRARASPADQHRPGGPRSGEVQAALLRHLVHRGLGALRRAPGRGSRLLPGPLQLLRPSAGRDAARDPARGGHGAAFEEVDAPAGRRLLPRPLDRGRGRHPERDGPLHGHPQPGARRTRSGSSSSSSCARRRSTPWATGSTSAASTTRCSTRERCRSTY